MGMLFGLLLTGFAVVGVYKFLTSADFRAELAKEFIEDPWFAVFALFGGFCAIAFIWCLIIPPLGTLRIQFGRDSLPLWGVAGLGVVAWSVIGIVGSAFRSKGR
jgi:hypothetical protein